MKMFWSNAAKLSPSPRCFLLVWNLVWVAGCGSPQPEGKDANDNENHKNIDEADNDLVNAKLADLPLLLVQSAPLVGVANAQMGQEVHKERTVEILTQLVEDKPDEKFNEMVAKLN